MSFIFLIPSPASKGLAREEVESNLIFCGFVAFSCLVRKDTALIVKELQNGSHTVAMATGDAVLTAVRNIHIYIIIFKYIMLHIHVLMYIMLYYKMYFIL
jgi:hypothetical protein